MEIDDVNISTVRRVIAELPNRFRTKDVSEHPQMQTTHRLWAKESHYHSVVGRALSNYRGAQNLRLTSEPANKRGALWEKIGGATSES